MTNQIQPTEHKREFIEPGWYRNISNNRYHGSYGFSSSQVKFLLEKTPAHLKADMTQTVESKKHLILGDATHCLILEPDQWDNKFCIKPDDLKKPTKAQVNAKIPSDATIEQIKQWQEWETYRADRQEITNTEHAKAKAMAENLGNFIADNPFVSDVVEGAIHESSIYWWFNKVDPEDTTEYKFMAKCRPDMISTTYNLLPDVKSCADATESGIQNAICNFYYDVSAAMYLYGVNQCKPLLELTGNYAYTGLLLLCVESEKPHLPNFKMIGKEFLKQGRHNFQIGIKRLQNAIDNGWPGFPNEVHDIEPPTYRKIIQI